MQRSKKIERDKILSGKNESYYFFKQTKAPHRPTVKCNMLLLHCTRQQTSRSNFLNTDKIVCKGRRRQRQKQQ